MTSPGELDRRLILQAPSEMADAQGGVTRDYIAVTTLWAQVLPQGKSAQVDADSLGVSLRFRIIIRKRDDVTLRHRLQEGETIYRIVSARESADRRFVEIDAEVRRD